MFPAPGIVHLKTVMRDHPVLGSVVSGSRLELRERDVRRAHDMGYEVRDIPDDGRDHPYWPTQGPGGSNPCPVCTSLAAMAAITEFRPRGIMHRALMHGLLRHPFYVLTGLGREPQQPGEG